MRVFGEGEGRRVVLSVGDLTTASSCEFAVVRSLDAKLGRIDPPATEPDALLARAAQLGDRHEARLLHRYEQEVGAPGRVITLGWPSNTLSGLAETASTTLELLKGGVDVLAQGTVFDGGLVGHPDFLVLEAGAYVVEDAKLARSAKVSALLQIAAYADMLSADGVRVAPMARLAHGSGKPSDHRLADLIPVYRERRSRLESLVAGRMADSLAAPWGDERYRACGRCDICQEQVEASRDLLLVAGMRLTQRARLRAEGILTIEGLASSTTPVEGISDVALAVLREQAALQVAQDSRVAAGEVQPNGWPVVEHRVVSPTPLRQLPSPSAGDVFFDFEGDPLWVDSAGEWGLEYLFGVCDVDGTYQRWWAHDRDQEKQALVEFMNWLVTRRVQHPDLHVYHYAAYEPAALKRLVGRHGVCEEELDVLLRAGVFVDLYSTVRQSIRVSQPSYSIKYLEPLYMAERRSEDLDKAADSVAMFALATERLEAGEHSEATLLLERIQEYNAYDVRSTLHLRDWLRSLVRSATVEAHPDDRPRDDSVGHHEPSEERLRAAKLSARLDSLAVTLPDGDERTATLLLSASLGYHAREDKPMWWEHFDRLVAPVDDWRDQRGVFVPDEVLGQADDPPAWAAPTGRQRNHRRTLRLVGGLPEGSDIGPGWKGYPVYEPPLPPGLSLGAGAVRAVTAPCVTVQSVDVSPDGRDVVTVEETSPPGPSLHALLPMAIVPENHVNARNLVQALLELGEAVAEAGHLDLGRAGLDLIRRRPPALDPELTASAQSGDHRLIASAVRGLGSSFVAVQGPPGTGKTYAGAHVVAALVEQGWKVGVVAQSHAVVENLLEKVIEVGVPAVSVAKEPKPGELATPAGPVRWRTGTRDLVELLAGDTGAVIGGTAWTMTNTAKVPRGSLDLLVIDEAGQFSLANTLAVSVAARRLLLLGDPQQLPQVSHGTHPQPVDDSALGWLMKDSATLPPELGFFLSDTRRMHPELTRLVSRLAYDDRLRSVESVTAVRLLEGVSPGLHAVPVNHLGNAVCAREEVVEVERLIRGVLGRGWRASAGAAASPLSADGVMVVAPYNAQVNALRLHLSSVGLDQVRVGTVDKFQGQEAPVVIVSMTASSPADVPRGMGFLLNRNRINVAISRAQWATYVVHSPSLTDYYPATPHGLAELGAFLGLLSSGGRLAGWS